MSMSLQKALKSTKEKQQIAENAELKAKKTRVEAKEAKLEAEKAR